MKSIAAICISVILALFVWQPTEEPKTDALPKVDVVSPELKECQLYEKKIKENLEYAKHDRDNK